MRKHFVLFVAMCLLCMGCVASIDKKWAAVNQRQRDANMAFAAAAGSFVNGAKEMVDKKHGLQEAHIARDWEEFYTKNIDAAGKIAVVKVKQRYAEATVDRQTLEKSQRDWLTYQAKFVNAIEMLKRATISTEATEAEILAAKESAQAYLDAAIGVLGGVAAGAMLVP